MNKPFGWDLEVWNRPMPFIDMLKRAYRYSLTTRLKKNNNNNDDNIEEEQEKRETEQLAKRLVPSVMERGIAECATVESLWLSCIHYLQYLVQTDNTLARRLQSVVDRSFRNCSTKTANKSPHWQ